MECDRYVGYNLATKVLAGDVRHASRGIRSVFTERVKHRLAYSADRMEGGDAASPRARAVLSFSAGLGGLSLARAVSDKELSREILAALREQLIALTKICFASQNLKFSPKPIQGLKVHLALSGS